MKHQRLHQFSANQTFDPLPQKGFTERHPTITVALVGLALVFGTLLAASLEGSAAALFDLIFNQSP